jgi:anthranilate phosphoribosyltransferase
MDAIALHADTVAAEVDGAEVREFTITPADLGLDDAPIEAVAGGTPEENAADLRGIVDGSMTGAKRDLILANAGAAIYVAGEADSLRAGVERAAEAIDSGAAAAKFAALCGAPAEGSPPPGSGATAEPGPEDD